MISKYDQRKEFRLKYKNSIKYEECLDNGLYADPVVADTVDIGAANIGFNAIKEFKLNTQLRITCNISEAENVSFVASVVRIELNRRYRHKYLVGAVIKNISEEDSELLKSVLNEINIYPLLDTIDLENVVDIHFIPGSPVVLKKEGEINKCRAGFR